MEKIDWSKAPEGATHYWPGNSRFYEKVGDSYFVSGQQNYGPVNSPESWVKKLVARPSPAWSGDGLPPVGLVLEYMWNYKPEGSEYVQVEILAHDKGSAIMRTLDGPDPGVLRESRGGNCGPGSGQPIFRPIRTPEQIAADEREAAIKEMLEDAGRPDTAKTRDQAQLLYDAGWRKVGRAQ